MIVQLLNDLKKMRDDMVARNYPFQQLSNLIVKYENLLDEQKTPSEKLQDLSLIHISEPTRQP